MEKIKLSFAVIISGSAIFLAFTNAWSGNWWAAVMYVLYAVCLLVILSGFDESKYFSLGITVPIAISFFLIFAGFPSQKLIGARSDVQRDFIAVSLDQSKCTGNYKEVSEAIEIGLKSCSVQGMIDITGLIGKAVDAIYLPPAVGIAKDVVTMGSSTPDNCARMFVTAEKLCPGRFTSVDPADRTMLYGAAK